MLAARLLVFVAGVVSAAPSVTAHPDRAGHHDDHGDHGDHGDHDDHDDHDVHDVHDDHHDHADHGDRGDRDYHHSPSDHVVVVGPPIRTVLSKAYAAAGLDNHPSASWNRRARLGALVPWLSVRSGRNTSWQTVDPAADIDRRVTIDVRATWRLDRLVFDGRELQAATIEAARRRERRRLASQVIQLYFAWRRAAELTTVRPSARRHAEQAAAELDALTDGWFTNDLAASRRTASETRTVAR